MKNLLFQEFGQNTDELSAIALKSSCKNRFNILAPETTGFFSQIEPLLDLYSPKQSSAGNLEAFKGRASQRDCPRR